MYIYNTIRTKHRECPKISCDDVYVCIQGYIQRVHTDIATLLAIVKFPFGRMGVESIREYAFERINE